jgi:CRP-like cAMP-binding protein
LHFLSFSAEQESDMVNTRNSRGTDKRQLNHLLSVIALDVQQRLFKHLELVRLPSGKVLYESGEIVRQAYFPVDCTISQQYVTEGGASTAISLVGNEGMVGVSLFMGGERTPSRAVVQNPGEAYRLAGQHLKDEFNRHGEMMRLLLRYTQSLITQVGQTAACNRHHSIDQQLARWLLLSLDRAPDTQLDLTHESIGNMLGVRREGVTEAAGKLQRARIINYSRGHITVLDRPALEALSCECYTMVKRESDRLLPVAQRLQEGQYHAVQRSTLSIVGKHEELLANLCVTMPTKGSSAPRRRAQR